MSTPFFIALRRLAPLAMGLVVAVLAGCASGPQANPRDPLEPLNRGIYQFNDVLDRAVAKPVASAYKEVVPSPIRTGVRNFFHNLEDLWSFVNNTLQLKGEAAGNSIVRFGVNTAFGLGGVLDIASEMGVERRTRDFGTTLGYWGVGPGPYLVLPVLGPSTLRDTAAWSAEAYGDPVNRLDHVPTRNAATVVRLVDKRANLLSATDMLDQVSLDPYSFVRDAYLQRRQSLIGRDTTDLAPPSDERYDDTPPPAAKP
jgi:phospholipid-binding lipoprotein MlaA